MRFNWNTTYMEAAEGDKGGGAEASGLMAEHKASQAAAEPGQEPGGEQQTGTRYDSKPDWMDPQFYNDETGMVDVENMQKSQRDFRTQAKKNDEASGVPETAIEYEFDHADSLQLDADDPLVKHAQEAALKFGLSKEAYAGFMGEMMAKIGDMNGTAEIDAQAEREALGPNHERVLQDLSDKIDKFVDIGLFGEADYDAAIDVAASAPGVRMLNKLIDHYQNRPTIPVNTTVPEGQQSKDELDAIVGTKEYNENPAIRAKIKAGYEKLYGKK